MYSTVRNTRYKYVSSTYVHLEIYQAKKKPKQTKELKTERKEKNIHHTI